MNETDPASLWDQDGAEEDAEDDVLISMAASLADIARALKSINASLLSLVETTTTAADTTPPWLRKNKEKKPSPTIKRKGPPCPDCEEPLVERHGPRGPFWGCVNYPKCRGSRNMDQQEHSRDRTEDDGFEEGPF